MATTTPPPPAPPAPSSSLPYVITFLAGASYGMTAVFIGQPLDTIKTRMQGLKNINANANANANAKANPTAAATTATRSKSAQSAAQVFWELYGSEGIRGLYRGGLPLVIGGSVMRSAQFGVSAEASNYLKRTNFPRTKLFGTIDTNVVVAGIAGGIGRAMVEIPTDLLKIRTQVSKLGGGEGKQLSGSVRWTNLLDGSAITFARNTVLFASFIVYIDFSKQACQAGYVPSMLCTEQNDTLTPFFKGAICANLAWLTCWPVDVLKTQRQSGNFTAKDVGTWELVKTNYQKGHLFRGLVPGLTRSFMANGASMVVYESVHSYLSEAWGVARTDMV